MKTHPYEDRTQTDNFAFIIEQRRSKAAARGESRAKALREFDRAFERFGKVLLYPTIVLLVCGLGGCLAMILAGRR